MSSRVLLLFGLFGRCLPLLVFLNFIPAHGRPLRVFGNTGKWTYLRLEPGSLEAKFMGGAEAILVQEVKDTAQQNPPIRILRTAFANAPSLLPAPIEAWRSAVFEASDEKGPAPKFIREHDPEIPDELLKREGYPRFLSQFKTKREGAAVMHTALMATVADGHLYVFIFEDREDVFKRHIGSVRKLYKSLTILN
ncbi:MAG: hypothetical protein AB7G93_09355 [Bdellovibrionales bacterium]